MLERFILLAGNFSQILLTVSGKDVPTMITGPEFRCIEEVCTLLKPIEQLTRELSTEKFFMSCKVIPILFCTRNEIIKQTPTIAIANNLKMKIIEKLDYRFGMLEHTALLPICTILDPRFKDMHFKHPLFNSRAQDEIVKMMDNNSNCDTQIVCSTENEEETADNNQYNLWSLHRTLEKEHMNKRAYMTSSREEQQSYLRQNVAKLNTNPLDEWENIKTVYKNFINLHNNF